MLTVGLVGCIALVGFLVVGSMLASEYWCSDRWPWWGPPEDPNSTCSGHAWGNRHPDDYPWKMPK